MKGLIIYSFFVLLFITISCSKKANFSESEVVPPKAEATKVAHKIVGKWLYKLDNNYDKRIIELNFSEDGNLKVNSTCCGDDKPYIKDYKYQILDENKVEFDYSPTAMGEPIVIVGEVNEAKLKTQCFHKFDRKKHGIIDPPLLCWFNDFKKVE